MHLTMLILRSAIRSILCLRALLTALTLVAALTGPVSAAPAAVDDQERAFLDRLVDEINQRRELAGTQPLALMPSATPPLDDFFAQTLPELAWPGPCVHHLVDGEDSASYVQASGVNGEARGEVLACPGPEPYWTPDRTADEWWSSPGHFDVLYGDPDANALACSAVGVHSGAPTGGKGKKKGGGQTPEAASAVLCVTFLDPT